MAVSLSLSLFLLPYFTYPPIIIKLKLYPYSYTGSSVLSSGFIRGFIRAKGIKNTLSNVKRPPFVRCPGAAARTAHRVLDHNNGVRVRPVCPVSGTGRCRG